MSLGNICFLDKANQLSDCVICHLTRSICSAVVLGSGEKSVPGGTGSSTPVCHWKVCRSDFVLRILKYTKIVHKWVMKSPSVPGFHMVALPTWWGAVVYRSSPLLQYHTPPTYCLPLVPGNDHFSVRLFLSHYYYYISKRNFFHRTAKILMKKRFISSRYSLYIYQYSVTIKIFNSTG